MSETKKLIKGLSYAGVACVCWGTLYIDISFIDPYGSVDLMIVRFVSAALIVWLIFYQTQRDCCRIYSINSSVFLSAIIVGFLGYTGYYVCLATSVKYTSEIITLSVIGLIPITTMIANNVFYQKHSWIAVSAVAILGLSGTVLTVADQAVHRVADDTVPSRDIQMGIVLAIIALGMWTAYQVLNRILLFRRSEIKASEWTELTIQGSFWSIPLCVLLTFVSPLRSELMLFVAPVGMPTIYLAAWGLFLAVGASVIAIRAWNESQAILPEVLSGQPILFLMPFVISIGSAQGSISLDTYNTWAGLILLFFAILLSVYEEHRIGKYMCRT